MKLAIVLAVLLCAVPALADDAGLQASQQDMQWWRDARLGMFVHWGPVSLKGTEISWSRGKFAGRGLEKGGGTIPVAEYDNLYKQFNPAKFNADEWVRVAKAMGARYIVFTTKHHDGFCEFDSKLTDYDIMNSPYGKDVVAQLAKACHKAKIRLGFYYSPPDFHHPDYFTANHARYIEYMHGQLRELCTNYGQVDIIWFDGLYSTSEDLDSPRMIKMIRRLQPHVLINNRAGLPADFGTPEQEVGGFDNTRPWESCITIGDQWAYKPNDRIKSLEECVRTVVRCACGDGNLLFNVGPMPTGEIEPRQVERLKEMGAWMHKYGSTVYGTRGGPFIMSSAGGSTYKGDRVYLHVLEWPDEGALKLPAIGAKIVGSRSITGGKATVNQTGEAVEVSMPKADRQVIDTIIELKLDQPASQVKPVRMPVSLSEGKKAKASNVYQNMEAFEAQRAFDGEPSSRWATDAGTHQAWLQVDLGAPATFDKATISEAIDRVQEFELQYRDGDSWKVCAQGKTIGRKLDLKFEPVTARFVRLNILNSTDGPTISEFQVMAKK